MKSLLPLVGIVAGLFLYAFPLLGHGLQNHRALYYLDGGAFDILKAWEGIYTQGPFYWGAFDPLYIYPKAYYNIAGLFLYPYGFLYGENMPLTMVVWRLCSLLWSIGSLFALYQLTVFVFRSRPAAYICCCLFALTPEVLGWAVNVRPDPMVNCMSFLALYFCARLCQHYSTRDFFLATLSGALAFSAKYGGIVFLFFIPLCAIADVWRVRKERPLFHQIIREQGAWMRKIYPIFFGALLVLGVVSWKIFASSGFDAIQGYLALTKGVFPDYFLPKVMHRLDQWKEFVQVMSWFSFGSLALIILFAGIGLALAVKRRIPGSLAFLFCHFAFTVIGIYGIVFFLLSPAYVTNIPHFLSEFGYTVYYMSLGGSVGDGSSPGLWQYFNLLWKKIPGIWFLAGLFFFTALISLRDIRNTWQWLCKHPSALLLVLYVLAATYSAFSLADPAMRHMLSGLAVFYTFISAAVVYGWLNWRAGLLNRAMSIVGTLLFIGFSASNISASQKVWKSLHESHRDIGFTAAQWLEDNYDSQSRLLIDNAAVYTPPEFHNVETTMYVERESKNAEEQKAAVSSFVEGFQPDLAIVTFEENDPRLVSLDKLLMGEAPFRGQYQLIKEFIPDRRKDKVDRIQIFARVRR